MFAITPELSLLIGNLLAFAFARRRGVTFVLEESRALTPETRELTFRAKRPVSFQPGQYAELTVPHAGVDGRGSRRSFSIASPPDPDGRVSFALRVPENSSSFKKALLALEPGDTVHATGIGGDFLLPSDSSEPLLLVAGGIGITPFLSQLRHESSRDAVLVYGVSSPDEVPFVEELAGVRVVLVGPACPRRPAGRLDVRRGAVPVARADRRRGAGPGRPQGVRLGSAGDGQRRTRRAGQALQGRQDGLLHRLLTLAASLLNAREQPSVTQDTSVDCEEVRMTEMPAEFLEPERGEDREAPSVRDRGGDEPLRDPRTSSQPDTDVPYGDG